MDDSSGTTEMAVAEVKRSASSASDLKSLSQSSTTGSQVAVREVSSVYKESVKKRCLIFERRFLLLVIYSISALLSGPIFFNFAPYQDIFHDENAWGDVCMPGDPIDPAAGCLQQKQKIANTFPVAVSCMFTMSFVGGLIVDSVGPKFAALCGSVLQVVGWVMLGASSWTRWNGWGVGLSFTALGVDSIFFSLVSICNLFPGWRNFIMSVLGCARSLSMAVGLVMRPLSRSLSFRAVAFGYAVILAAWTLMLALFVPWKPFLTEEEKAAMEADKAEAGMDNQSRLGKFIDRSKHEIRVTMKYGFSLVYIPVLLTACTSIFRNNVYGAATSDLIPKAKGLYEYANATSMIPCPFLGYIGDRLSAEVSMGIVQGFLTLSFFCVLSSSVAAQYISVVGIWFFMSFVLSQFYCYCQNRIPSEAFGKLTGFLSLVAGNVALLATPMYNYSSSKNSFTLAIWIGAVLGLLGVCTAIFEWFYNERKLPFKPKWDMKNFITQESGQ